MAFADGYHQMMKGRGRKKGLRPQTPGSVRQGGTTGHFAGSKGGRYAAAPHNGAHAGTAPNMPPPGVARSTGYVPGQYAAASPNQGFVLAGRGR